MSGSGRNEVISIKISVPLANAIEGALCVDAISLYGIFLPETSLHCTQLSVLLFLPEAQISGGSTKSTVWLAFVAAHILVLVDIVQHCLNLLPCFATSWDAV